MNLTSLPSSRERGAISVLMAVLLVAGVLLILGQTLVIMSTRSMDTMQQLDSNSALMLAESGLQRAHGAVTAVAEGGTMSNSTCAAVTGGPFSLGRGIFTLDSGVTTPSVCDELTGTCDTCKITVTGKVNAASRTLSQTYQMGLADGVAGNGKTVTMVLKNTWDTPAVSLFNMGWRRQDSGPNAEATFCSNGVTDCDLRVHAVSSTGINSSGVLGVTVKIPKLTTSKVVVQNLDQYRDYVEVGGLFPSTTTDFPTVAGSFWDDKNPWTKTAQQSASDGAVTNGVFGVTGACSAAPATYPSGGAGSYQNPTCTSWCRAADTLVFGVTARSSTSNNQISEVRFGTAPQQLALTKLVHFPNMDGSTPDAAGTVYSEIWYSYNPQYTTATPGSGGLGATSYPTAFTGSVGAILTPENIDSSATSITVPTGGFSGNNGRVCVGDTLVRTDGPNRFASPTTITSTPDGSTCSTSTGTYVFSPATNATGNMNNATVAVSSTKLSVTASIGPIGFALSTSASGGTVTIASGPAGGFYTLSDEKSFPAPEIYTQGNSGATITTPSGTPPTPGTVVAVHSATSTGQFAALSTVLASPAPTSTSFTVSAPPTTALKNATICGGTCAFFNSPSDSGSTTAFTLTKTADTGQWSGGFVCLGGVNPTRIRKIEATTLSPTRWHQSVQ